LSFSKRLTTFENSLTAIALLAMATLPLLEIAIRKFHSSGIPGSATWVQHLVLWVAFLGAAIAARRGELLSLSAVTLIREDLKNYIAVFTTGVSFAVCSALTWGSWDFVMAEREGGQVLSLGLPTWVAQLILPFGFAVIGIRILRKAPHGWKGTSIAASFALIPLLLYSALDLREGVAVYLFSTAILIAIAFGAPIFVGLGGIAALLTWNNFDPLAVIPLEAYNLVVKPMLPTIPLFTLAGYILAEGGTPTRLVTLFRSWFGWMPGGVAVVGILVCGFFTSFTGGSGVTILAMGGLLYPMLLQEKHGERFTTGLLTSAGSLGLLFPPSLAVIVYAVVAKLDVRRLFVSGLVPGILEIVLVSVFILVYSRRSGITRIPFHWKTAFASLSNAKWELAIPFVVLGSILGGLATIPETAAVTVLYAFALEFLIRRNLNIRKDLLRVVGQAAVLIGGVLIILGVAMGLTNYLVIADIPYLAVEWVQSFVESPLFFLLLLNVFLLAVGCLMDIYSAIVVVVPLMAPLGMAYGINPFHLGIIFLTNLELGYLTPPVGMNLFLASYRFKRPLPEVYKAALPFLAIRAIAVLLVTYVPFLTGFLPGLVLSE
jgi:tripartite ATP-independent transporter DctM subunit